MEDVAARVLGEFGVACGSVKKVKAAYVCGTDRGLLAVEQTRLSEERLRFLYEVSQRLAENGFTETDSLITTAGGEPFCEIDGELYTVRAYVGHLNGAVDTNFGDGAQLARVLPVIARLHTAMRGAGNGGAAAGCGHKTYEAAVSLVNRVKKTAYKNKPLSDFDVEFLKRFDFYMERLHNQNEAAERADVKGRAIAAAGLGCVCHNALKEEHVLLKGGAVYIIGFASAAIGSPAADIADVLARHLREGGGLPFDEAIARYSEINPLTEGDVLDVKARLLYPGRFLGLIERVYEKKRNWLPGAFSEKLAAVIKADEALDEYLK